MSAPAANPAADGALPRLAFELTARLRADGRLCNALTHISSGDWRATRRIRVHPLAFVAASPRPANGDIP